MHDCSATLVILRLEARLKNTIKRKVLVKSTFLRVKSKKVQQVALK